VSVLTQTPAVLLIVIAAIALRFSSITHVLYHSSMAQFTRWCAYCAPFVTLSMFLCALEFEDFVGE
jgi:hypothetical protein